MREPNEDIVKVERPLPEWRAPVMTRFDADCAETGSGTIADAGLATS